MCALFGIVGAYDATQARLALAKLKHRGPDSSCILEKPNLFFAHQRLSIMRDSANGYKHKEILVSFNGEIYNASSLRDDLKKLGCIFSSQSECELISHAFIHWGTEFIHKLRGMFSIALMHKETLYLFRDRLGKKPLFYLQNQSFIFASELKAIVPFLHKVEMDKDALLSYLSYLAPTVPFTFFKGIKKLGMGEYLVHHHGKTQVQRYSHLLDTPSNIITNKEDALDALKEKLQESIEIRLNADVPMASLLSGGIDSATLNFFAKENGNKLDTYTLGYEGYEKYDESLDALKSAKHLGLNNKQVKISLEDYERVSSEVFDSLDEPLNDPAAIPLYLLFEQIKEDGYKVVLSGEGADELFLGYRHYFNHLDAQQMKNMPNKNWLKSYFRANYNQNREWEWYKRALEESPIFRTSGEKFTDLQKNNLMKQNIKDNQAMTYLQDYREHFEHSKHNDESIWYTYADLHHFQAEHFLTKLDRVSMAHSIESRTPFLDHELVALILSIDPKLRYKEHQTKSLLKEIMRPHLGESIIKRKKKGFSNPYMEFLLTTGKINLIKEVNDEVGLFKTKELQSLLEGVSSGAFKHHIWGLYVLSVWIKRWLF